MQHRNKKNILILGATSSIARALSMELSHLGNTIYLAGRDKEELQKMTDDLKIRSHHQNIFWSELDIEKFDSHASFFSTLLNQMPDIDCVIFAIGTMEPPAQKILNTNFNGAVSILEICADYFEQKKSGILMAISSVAGDRGRKSNYIYGSAKGGLNIYLEGLRHRLSKNHIRVMTIKLGFVDTAMTFGLPGLFLVASPQNIARKIIKKLNQKHYFLDIIYLPWFWRYIMFIIKNIPDIIFNRMSL